MQCMYSTEDHATWAFLFDRQLQRLDGVVHSRFTAGIEKTNLKPDVVPQRDSVCIAPGWTVVRAEQEYLTDDEWFSHLAKKEFPVTDYIRPPESRVFTPLPDLFHDYFGHLAVMQDEDFAALAHEFGTVYWQTPQQHRHIVARLWWHTAEFGLLKEGGVVKVFGAGLISSPEELEKSLDATRHLPFSLDTVANTPKAKYETHQQFFVLESLEQVRTALNEHKETRCTARIVM